MEDKRGMNYIYVGGKAFSIENTQKEIRSEFAENFKKCRNRKHITQRQLAITTGIPQPNITRFESENSNPSLELMVKMATALGMKLKITLEENPEEN